MSRILNLQLGDVQETALIPLAVNLACWQKMMGEIYEWNIFFVGNRSSDSHCIRNSRVLLYSKNNLLEDD